MKRTLAQRLWFGFAKAVGPFFFSTRSQQGEDHLVEVVRRNPEVAAHLIQSIAMFSIVWNFAVGISCVAFLLFYWPRCGDCDRPLRWWLLMQAVLQFNQLPVRLVLYMSVRSISGTNGNIEACVASL